MEDYRRIEKSITYLFQHYKEQPSLETLSGVACLSPFHFQRKFVEWAGISPKKFNQFLTLQHLKGLLRTDAVSLQMLAEEAGLSSTSRVHDLFIKIEGMTPKAYAEGGKNLVISYGFYGSSFGLILIASTEKGICKVSFVENKEDAKRELVQEWPQSQFLQTSKNEMHQQVLETMLEGKNHPLVLNIRGTAFQIKVWEALLSIPEGETVNYQHIATHIQKPKANRAVGTAIGKNPIAVLIPCHRVIQKQGGIGGYRWGKKIKEGILLKEYIQHWNAVE